MIVNLAGQITRDQRKALAALLDSWANERPCG
jgi:hypothetical protein